MVSGSRNRFFVTLLPVVILILTSFNVSAQKNSDIGIFGGTSYYMGDLNSSVHYAAPKIAAGAIYRYNFNERNSLRGHAFYHGLSASNPDYFGPNVVTGVTNFDAKFVDLGLDFEFNWKPYKTAYRKTKATPYVFAGIGFGLRVSPVFAGNGLEGIGHFTLPFGAGYKVNLGPWLSAGFEAGVRKTFTDKVELSSELPEGITNPDIGELTLFGNRDWYFFTGFFVTYKIFKFWEECHAYD